MSISTLLNIGQRALTADYAALQVTGNNIANANTPSYSRESVELASSFSQQTGSGFFGRGVDVVTVKRSHDEYLTREAATTASLSASDDARSTQLQTLENAFKTGTDGLGHTAQVMFDSFVDVANKPQDSSARQVALARVGDFASQLRSTSDQLDSQQTGIVQDLKTSVASINSLTGQIADLNERIASALSSGQAPNALQDQRDQALKDLGQLVGVTTLNSADGTVGVFLGGGQKLVLGGDSTQLTTVSDQYDPSKVQLAVQDGAVARALPDGYVTGGSVAGLLQVQNHDIPDARAQLGQFAAAITGALNQQQALGLDLHTPAASGAPLLAIGAPAVAASTNNATSAGVPVASYVNGSGVRVSSVSIATVDSSSLQASDYELYADPALPAGQYQLTRISDGTTQTVSDGSVVDGFKISVQSPPGVAARDRFLLQPVSTAARAIAKVLDDPSGIAAASPVAAVPGAGNTGTATVQSLSAVSTSLNNNLVATISFTDDTGDYSYSLVDTTGTLPTVNGTGTYSPSTPISLNGWQMSLNGSPKTGDSIVVAKTTYPAGDNGNANAMLALGSAAIVGKTAASAGQSITDSYASTLASVGVRVQSAKAAADHSSQVATDAQTAASNSSGVNLDEEAARLIQYQQSYQAAAKILQVAQTVFDTLLQVGSTG